MPSIEATLQISLAPSDYPHAQYLLKHQIETWRSQVTEILVTIDTHRSKGRFSTRWEEGKKKIGPLVNSIPGIRVVEVDYSETAERRISAEFFSGRHVPRKDFRGGPYYAYFFGLNAASHDLVLHTDSDMFFGGGSQHWLAEAKALMDEDTRILVSAPLPGPPRPDGIVQSQTSTPYSGRPAALVIPHMSTRLFLMSRGRFKERIGALRPAGPPALRAKLKAFLERNPAEDLPEHLVTHEMEKHGLIRVDFLGTAPGMWSLHPPYRCADFYRKLPDLVRAIEAGTVPDAQRGDHDFNDSMVDWTEATDTLRSNRWWKRLLKR